MRFGGRAALGFGVSALLLWYALSGVDLTEVARELRGSDLTLWALCTVASQLIFPLRALRWRVILDPTHPKLPLGSLWRATAIGMMVNNVVPARAGELARVFALTREQREVRFSTGLASLAVDRVFDAGCVVLLLVLAMYDPQFPAGVTIAGRPIRDTATAGLVLVVGAFVALYVVARFPERFERVARAVTRRVLPRFEARVGALVHALAGGLAVLRSPLRFLEVFAWALAHWLMNAFAFWLGFRAVGIDAPASAALLVQGLIAIGVSIPSSPGFFGIFETIAKVALPIYGIDATRAVVWALGFHILSFIPITVIGAWYFARLGVRLGDLASAEAAAAADPAP
ncbi:MAG: flippase-like domain-containing protein [Gemmatimonadaceae bacterium]|nr:flippase-like domain-containing protein [Gemmatimonadaceae bacterium]